MKVLTLYLISLVAVFATEATETAEHAARWAAYEQLAGTGAQGEKILPRFETHTPLDGAQRVQTIMPPAIISSSRMYKKNQLVKVPCPFDACYVTGMEATIKYSDGAEANVDTGAWLHHIAMMGSLGGGGGGGGIWAAGNERPTLRLNSQQHKYGLDFSRYVLVIDLMSEDVAPKNVTLIITYEVVPKSRTDYKPAHMYWLTVGEPAAKQGKFSFTTRPMLARSDGQLLYSIGHMHDGGTDMQLKVGGKAVCTSKMFYNARVGYSNNSRGDKSKGHSHKQKRSAAGGGGGNVHISDPGACTFFGDVRSGSRLVAVANYDTDKYALMHSNGKPENLMG